MNFRLSLFQGDFCCLLRLFGGLGVIVVLDPLKAKGQELHGELSGGHMAPLPPAISFQGIKYTFSTPLLENYVYKFNIIIFMFDFRADRWTME